MASIKLIISDFDGTLVDTFKANFLSYREAFRKSGLDLRLKEYKSFFGLRFDCFMAEVGVTNEECKQIIKENKKQIFANYFKYIRLNEPLIQFLKAFRNSGGIVAIASTADRVNLLNLTDYLGITLDFNMILTGEEVVMSKPHPEIYITLMKKFSVSPRETLIFEDSEVGLQAARASDASYIKISAQFFRGKY